MLGIWVIFIELSSTIFIELSSTIFIELSSTIFIALSSTIFIELSIFVFLTKYYLGDQTKEDEMGSAYGKHGGKQKCIQDSGQKPEGKRPLEDRGTQ